MVQSAFNSITSKIFLTGVLLFSSVSPIQADEFEANLLNQTSGQFDSDVSLEVQQLVVKATENTEARRKFLLAVRLEVRDIVAKAYHNPAAGPRAKQIYSRLWNHLGKKVINFTDPNSEYAFCKARKDVAAFVKAGAIYYCSSFLESAEYDRPYLLATLVHETAHATNVDAELNERDHECGAMAAEISAMNHGGRSGSPSMHNGFIVSGRCKISRTYVIPERG